jgi:hypothetical protein
MLAIAKRSSLPGSFTTLHSSLKIMVARVGKGTTAKEIVINSKVHSPVSAKLLLSTLDKESPRNKSGK